MHIHHDHVGGHCHHDHHHDHEGGHCHDHEHHDHECGHCHDHDHGHHHHHHADDVFDSWGAETAIAYTADEIQQALEQLEDSETYGMILRAKGIVAGKDGRWIHYDYVPGSADVRFGGADVIGRLCVIGSHINKAALTTLFRVAEG